MASARQDPHHQKRLLASPEPCHFVPPPPVSKAAHCTPCDHLRTKQLLAGREACLTAEDPDVEQMLTHVTCRAATLCLDHSANREW